MIMDQGWCGTSFLIRIREGEYEGIDLGGQNAVVGLFFPGPTLFDGNGTGRVYIDEGATTEQQGALEKILQGLPGGGMEVPATTRKTVTSRPRLAMLERWFRNASLTIREIG